MEVMTKKESYAILVEQINAKYHYTWTDIFYSREEFDDVIEILGILDIGDEWEEFGHTLIEVTDTQGRIGVAAIASSF